MNVPILKYPVKRPKIIQEFAHDNTNHPIRKNFYKIFDNKHPGVDFDIPTRSNIYSSINGIVVREEFHKGMGNVIGVRNGNIITLYAHLNKISVKLGDIVKAGDVIGLSGNTGATTINIPHLHFEIRDIRKDSLRKMVFKPIFRTPIKQWREEFTYRVNNTNTQKTLITLSSRYFGTTKLWKKIYEKNSKLSINPNRLIPTDSIIIIPNYNQ